MIRVAGPLLAVLLGGLVLKALIGALEPRMVFFPYRGEDETPARLGLRYQQLSLSTSDGERLTGEPWRPAEASA